MAEIERILHNKSTNTSKNPLEQRGAHLSIILFAYLNILYVAFVVLALLWAGISKR